MDETSKALSADSPSVLKLTNLHNQVQYAQVKIQHLNDFATHEYQNLTANMETFSMQAVADDVLQNLKKRMGIKNVNFTLNLS